MSALTTPTRTAGRPSPRVDAGRSAIVTRPTSDAKPTSNGKGIPTGGEVGRTIRGEASWRSIEIPYTAASIGGMPPPTPARGATWPASTR